MADTGPQGGTSRGDPEPIDQPDVNAEGEQGQEGKGKCRTKLSAKTRMDADEVDRQGHPCALSLSLCLLHTHAHLNITLPEQAIKRCH